MNEEISLRFPIILDGGNWMIEQYDTTKIKLISLEKEFPKQPEDKNGVKIFIAGGGMEIWSFKFIENGTYRLVFYYKYYNTSNDNKWQQIRKIIAN